MLFRSYEGIELEPSPAITFAEALAFANESESDHTNNNNNNNNNNSATKTPIFIDTRTPAEYREAHVWDAINIPLMSDTQRHVIGKTYHHVGRRAAIALGWTMFSPLVQKYLQQFARYRGRRLFVYCWRGGMRSRIVTNLLLRSGYDAVQVTGGYKVYLNQIVWRGLDQFAAHYPPRFIVLFGSTGTGKTELLTRLSRVTDDGDGIHSKTSIPVIDLEGLAGHRSSVYGAVDLVQASQKMFSIGLYHKLHRFRNEPYIFLEGEAHKVGNVHIPTFLQERIAGEHGTIKILITASMERRVALLKNEYLKTPDSVKQIRQATETVRKYIGNKHADHLQALLDVGDYGTFTEWLLVNHYDANYRCHKQGHDYALTASSDDMGACCAQLKTFYRNLLTNDQRRYNNGSSQPVS